MIALLFRHSFDFLTLPSERGEVKPVDCPTGDERPRVLKSRGRKKQEKRGGIGGDSTACGQGRIERIEKGNNR